MDMEGAISVDNNYLERLFPAFLEIGDQELRERSELLLLRWTELSEELERSETDEG